MKRIIKGDVTLSRLGLKEPPEWMKDVSIYGRFDCSGNMLTSLKNAPKKVYGHFNCSFNCLKDLMGSPLYVAYDFACYANPLVSLKGAPLTVGWDFIVSDDTFDDDDVAAVSDAGGVAYIVL